MSEHYGQHTDCFGCKLRTLNFATSGELQRVTKDEQQLSRDLDAYKRLRHNGLQPRHVDGSAEVEAQANDAIEVERHAIFSRPIRQEIKQKAEELAATGSITTKGP